MKSDRVSFSILIAALALGLATAGCGVECRPRASTVCQGGITYWVDSCDQRQDDADYQVCPCGCDALGEFCQECGCEPNCDGRECGPDGCGGECGPGCGLSEVCESGQCRACQPDCDGRECGPDGCGGQCGIGCGRGQVCTEDGQCEACEPDCTGRECGSDGCGGECGPGCSLDETCTADGQCQGCQPACDGRECGPDGCGGQCGPGCAADEFCNPTGQCEACQPDCAGRQCGPDGCGGQCGPGCGPDQACTEDGQCQGCIPDCDGRECGDDGCGGVCGTCGDGQYCVEQSVCQAASATTCWTGSDFRTKRTPQAGDLMVTEVMADPEIATDANGEWFEIWVRRDLDLNGLSWGRDAASASVAFEEGDCLAVSAGTLLLVAKSEDPAANGGLPAPDALLPFNLLNSNGGIYLGFYGQTVDQVSWAQTQSGVASSLDPVAIGPDLNDDPIFWCTPDTSYGLGDLGTPGSANPSCGLGELTCGDGGVQRLKVLPDVGDLVISEFMADPTWVSDAHGEWLEVTVLAEVDLNGLALGRDDFMTQVVPEGECFRVPAGTRLLFTRDPDPATNGGLHTVDGVFEFNLLNDGGWISVGLYDQVLDLVSYGAVEAGVASSLDPDRVDVAQNDSAANWCPAVTIYNPGDDLGTPADPNPQCP